jgi:hypothetical protein
VRSQARIPAYELRLGGKNKGKSWDVERPIILKAHEVRGILDGRQSQLRRIMKPQPSDFKGGIHPNNVGRARNKPVPYFDAYCGQKYTEKNPRGMSDNWCWWTEDDRQGPDWIKCPFGRPGDRLWVREAFGLMSYDQGDECKTDIIYREDPWFLESDGKTRTDEKIGNWDLDGGRWRPAQHMHRYHSRILLEIVSVRVERLQDISEDDALAEGFLKLPASGRVVLNKGDQHFGKYWMRARSAFEDLWMEINGPDSWKSNPWVWVVEFKRVEGGQ